MKTVEICCSKTCADFWRCYGNKGWVGGKFQLCSSRHSWDIIERLPWGGGGAQCAPALNRVKEWGKKRETGEVGVGADNHERRARKRTGWKAHIESKTQGADLPSSWRSTSTKTHSLPRTLVFRGFTSHQLGSRSLTLGPPVDTALLRAMATSELPRQGANLSANRVDSSSSATPASPPVPILRLQTSERGWKCQRNNMNKPAHVSRLRG